MSNTLLKQDAGNRAQRAFVQGLAIDVLTAVAAALLLWLPDADLTSRDAWIVLGTGLARTVLAALASYVMRLKIDGSSIPTPLPPANPGEPDAPVVRNDGGQSALYIALVVLVVLAVILLLSRVL